MTWSELTNGPRITKEQFKAQLAQYPKSSILIASTKLSVGFGYGPDAFTVPPDNVADFHIPIVFPSGLVPDVNAWFHQEGRIPFFNGQLRYLAAETVRLQTEHYVPEVPENGPENEQFGELMLKAGELLYKKHVVVENELDGYANIAAEFLPTYEIASATDPLFSFLRFYIWLTKIIPRIPTNLLKFDLEAELDYEFSLGKLESAVIWRVLRSLPKDEKEPWLSYWGLVFEEYVTWMFEMYASPALHQVYPSPKCVNSTDQICDQIIVCGDTAVLIEAKLATCTAADRYSGDYEKIKAYLEEKLVTKGVGQLLNAVRRIGAKGADVAEYLQDTKKVIPLIITRDDFGGCWGVNAYLTKRLKDQLTTESHNGIVVTPLVSMNISYLKRMTWVLKEKAFADVMEELIETDPTLRQPFDAAVKYVQRGAAPKLHAHVDAYEELSERLIADFGMKEDEVVQPTIQPLQE